jgi:hypothetical protein
MAKSKADMDPNYEKRCRDLQAHAEREYQARKLGNQVPWFRPASWGGDPFDYDAMHPPFARDKANADFLAAVSNPADPGTTGDVELTTTEADALATMERAFRVRHTLRRPRAVAHLLSRKQGHGDPPGPLIALYVEHVRSLLTMAKKT